MAAREADSPHTVDALLISMRTQLDAYMGTVATGRTIDARGVEISSQLFSLIKERVPDMRWIDAQFDAATFDGNATFTSASFERRASF